MRGSGTSGVGSKERWGGGVCDWDMCMQGYSGWEARQ
jgi:hypothetical protein